MRLQQVELIAKALWIDHENTVTVGDTTDPVAERKQQMASKTLGVAVKALQGSYLGVKGADQESGDELGWTPSPEGELKGSFHFKHTIHFPLLEDYRRTMDDLDALVAMRNELVHHFIEQFDLWSEAGCDVADVHLDACFATIDRQYNVMLGWAKSAQETRAVTAAFVQSDDFTRLFFYGIQPDGAVDWATTPIVAALRHAEEVLSQDGWTVLDDAIRWLRTDYSDLSPALYGCSRWRHLLHESKLFEIKRSDAENVVPMKTRFRSKPER